ncbi:reverse transcriptase domain, reverse transcriptase zinc-binding domain protein [Tanacetum coccineum]
MEGGDWTEVSRRKKGSVFHRLQFPQQKASLSDDLAKISLTVYVSNFPSHLTVRELWNICGKKGTLVDVFIAKRKNKLRQMFAFCRFIKVVDKDTLINSLSNIWIRKLRLHANVARFERNVNNPSHAEGKKIGGSSFIRTKAKSFPEVVKNKSTGSFVNKASSYANVAKSSTCGGDKATNYDHEDKDGSVINFHENSNDFPLAILGCYNDFRSIANAYTLCRSEGFLDVNIKYLGGLWVLFDFNSIVPRNKFLKHKGIGSWFSLLKPWHYDFVVEERLVWLEIEGVPLSAWHNDTFTSIRSKWGEVIFCDDSDSRNRLSKCICIKSSHSQLIFSTMMVTFKKGTYSIRVRELCSWTPSFVDENSSIDEEGSMGSFIQEQEEEGEIQEKEDEVKDDIFKDLGVKTVDEHVTAHTFPPLNHSPKPNVEESPNDKEPEVPFDSDPFGLADLINNKRNMVFEHQNSETPEFPPGFPPVSNNMLHATKSDACNGVSKSVNNLNSIDAHK